MQKNVLQEVIRRFFTISLLLRHIEVIYVFITCLYTQKKEHECKTVIDWNVVLQQKEKASEADDHAVSLRDLNDQ